MTQPDLLKRRERVLANHDYFYYEEPLHIVRGEGIRLWDANGRPYLDCYNNVVSVGHCHPRVVEALTRQAGTLNTHTRYLHENVVELCERLGGKLPGDLDVCMIVCTGTEANDLAVQISRAVTGRRGVVVTDGAYHGNSALVLQLSPESCPEALREDWVGIVEPPNTYRGPFREGEHDALGARYAESVHEAVAGLEARLHGVAAMLSDSIWDANGALVAPEGYVAETVKAVRDAGGLIIQDEVQSGYTRTGEHWWGFEHYGVEPDIVTLGKPMGDGHPVAALVMTREVAERYRASPMETYFNTFGGNPVSAAVANAVIQVIDEEEILASVTDVGAYLKAGLEKLAERHEVMGNVQGRGLFLGIDLVEDRETRTPLSTGALRAFTTELVQQGVLMGTSGRFGNVLKIRPPLIFSRENADEAIGAIDRALGRFR